MPQEQRHSYPRPGVSEGQRVKGGHNAHSRSLQELDKVRLPSLGIRYRAELAEIPPGPAEYT